MHIRIKDLKQKEFKVEAEPSSSILDLKNIIEKETGTSSDEQKLIFSGKILANESTIEQAGINETGFVVLMVSKKQAAPAKPAQAAPKPAVPAPAPVAPTPVPVPEGDQMRPLETEMATDLSDPSALVTGSEYDTVISNFLEMGFPKEQIEQAMRAAYNNPVRATEYLLNGIPDALVAEAAARSVPTPMQASQNPVPSEAPEATGNLFQAAAQQAAARQQASGLGGEIDISALRQSSQFQLIRQAIQENPSLLQPILSSLGSSNPQLLQQISSNPDAFLQLLNESEDESAGATMGSEDGEGINSSGQHTIQVTPEESEAISRLEALGFDRNMVIQAYFACEKNEELAANYLFENGDD